MKFSNSSLLPQEEFINIIPNLKFKQQLCESSLNVDELESSLPLKLKFKTPSLRFFKTPPAVAEFTAKAPANDSRFAEAVNSASSDQTPPAEADGSLFMDDENDQITVKKRKTIKCAVKCDNLKECSMEELNDLTLAMDDEKSFKILEQLNLSSDLSSDLPFERNVKLVLLYTLSLNYRLGNYKVSQKFYSDSIFHQIVSTCKAGVELLLKEYQQKQAQYAGDLEKIIIILNELLVKKIIPAQEIITVSLLYIT